VVLKNQYVGNVGDFVKFALLRSLVTTQTGTSTLGSSGI